MSLAGRLVRQDVDSDSDSVSDAADADPSCGMPHFAAPASTLPLVAKQFVIDVPPKVWRPKPVDCYVPVDYSDDIDGDVFLFEQYGKAACQPTTPFTNTREDIHLWDRDRDLPEFTKNFVIGPDVPTHDRPCMRA
jgi:hypothetical protein